MFVNVCVSWAFSFKTFLYFAVLSKEIKKECIELRGMENLREAGGGEIIFRTYLMKTIFNKII